MVVSRRTFVLTTGATLAGAAVTTSATPAPMSATARDASWLADTVLYQIYPQSFADTDGSGVGDLRGIIEHLDYLRWLGVGAIWVSPIFPSPFTDAGYDIADYKRVHPRYGDEEEVALLAEAARTRGIRVLFDLVAGHTSNEHEWFLRSLHDNADDRYIWARPDQLPAGPLPDEFVASPGPRPGAFRKNYYATQPAINYGYARSNPNEPWREPVTADGPQRNRAAMRDVMDHWLRLGIAGFRCDLAATLVKDDPGRVETGKLWGEMRAWMDRHHPDAVLISEWGDPATSVPAGFDADFYLPVNGPGDGAPWKSLWRENPYFGADGTGTAKVFADAWIEATRTIGNGGHIMLPTANHDSANRLNDGVRTPEQLPAAFAFQLTWPTVPALYYGEEIGMRMVEGTPDVEGSAGRQRNRTPMQWSSGPNAGFSTAPAERLYIPIDPDPHRPTVESQLHDRGSLLHFVRRLLALRKQNPELGTRSGIRMFDLDYPLTYLRGDRFLITVNPRRDAATVTVPDRRVRGARLVEDSGVRVDGETLSVPGFGYAILDLTG